MVTNSLGESDSFSLLEIQSFLKKFTNSLKVSVLKTLWFLSNQVLH